MTTATAVIADANELVREAFAAWIAPPAGVDVIGSAASADEMLDRCSETKPRIVIVDLELPGRDVFASLHELRRTSPATRILVLTGFVRDGLINAAIDVGAEGYVLKSEGQSVLIDYLRTFTAGEKVYSEAVRQRLDLAENIARSGEAAPIARLTRREQEVLRYIGRGLGTEEMAETMELSRRTVERHIQRLMTDLDLHDRASLTRYAFREGLVV